MGIIDSAKNLVTGDDRTEFKDVPEFSILSHFEDLHDAGVPIKNLLKIMGGNALTYSGDDQYQTIAHNLKHINDKIGFTEDKFGNKMIAYNDKLYYINKPGLSMADAAPAAIDAASMLVAPELKLAGLAGKGIAKGVAKIAGKTAGNFASKTAGYGGYEEAKKIGVNDAQDKDLVNGTDISDSLLEGALGGGLDMGAGLAGNGLSKIFKGVAKPTAEQIANSPKFIQDAIKRGGEDEELAHALITGRMPNENGMPLTKGQATGNSKLIAQENSARNNKVSEKANNYMQSLDNLQKEGLDNQLLNINKGFNPNASMDASSLNNAGESILNKFNEAKNSAKQNVSDAYNKVNLSDITLLLDKTSLNKVIDDNTDPHLMKDVFGDYPDYAKTINHIKEALPELNNMQDMEGIRQGLNNKISTLINRNPNLDKTSDPMVRSLLGLKNGIDDHIDELANNGMLGGSKEAISDLKNARSANTDYQQKYNFVRNERGANNLLSNNLDDNLTSEGLLNILTNTSPSGSTKAVGAIKRIKDVLGENSPEFNELKEHFLLKTFAPDVNASGNLTTNVDKAIESYNKNFLKNNSVTKELYSPDELSGIDNFASSLNKVNFANSVTKKAPSGDLLDGISSGLARVKGGDWLAKQIEKIHPSPINNIMKDSLGLNPKTLAETNPKLDQAIKAMGRTSNLAVQQDAVENN